MTAMHRPTRVLYLRDTGFVCGPGKTIVNTARCLDSARFSLRVRVPVSNAARNPFVDRLRELGVDAEPMPVPNVASGIARLARLLKDQQIEIVQSHDFFSRQLAVPAAALAGVPHVTSVHGWITNTHKEHIARRIDQWLIARAAQVIVVSSLLRDQVLAAGCRPERLHLLPNAVLLADHPLDTTPRGEARQRLGLPADCEVVTIVGRLSPEKGHALFLEMCGRIAAERRGTYFLIAGHGPLREALERDAQSRRIADRVRFLGLRGDMHQIYAATDVLALCSTTEGLPNVILEAFAHRRAAVATRVGGVPDLVINDRTGCLVESGDIEALTANTLRLLKNPEVAERFGSAGRRLVESNYDFNSRTANVSALYDAVMAAKTAPATPQTAHLASRGGR